MLMDLHMHSNYSDGKNTPEEMIEACIEIGYDAVAITDHVWKSSLWVPMYAAHLNRLKRKYEGKIKILIGIEAKVVSLDGDIDADPSFYTEVDLVLGSMHRIPNENGYYSKSDLTFISKAEIITYWLKAFYGMLANPRVDIIAHPLSELKEFGISQTDLPIEEICTRIAASKKVLEFNVRYNNENELIIKHSKNMGIPFIISSDSHSVQDLIDNSKKIKIQVEKGYQIVDIPDYFQNKRDEN